MNEYPLIMAVDSDREFLELIAESLSDEGYNARMVEVSDNAFTVVKRAQPSVVILELSITDPERGWMLLNKMRLDTETKHIPVIVASTSTDLLERNADHLRKQHCDILIKPFDLEELLGIVADHVPTTTNRKRSKKS